MFFDELNLTDTRYKENWICILNQEQKKTYVALTCTAKTSVYT